MTVDRVRRLGAAVTLALGLAGGAATAQEMAGPIQKIPLDQTATAGDIEVGCTGIGSDQRDNPRWKSFPVKVMFAGPGGEYLGDEILSVSTANGRHLASVSCEGPWILLRLAPGRYTVTARPSDPAGDARSASFTAPKSGQFEVTLRWPTG